VNGTPAKAHDIVLDVIKRLRSGNVPKKELVILTQLQRKPESYQTTAPHVSAALKAQERGKDVNVGQMLGFIITKNGKSISDKAELEEFVKEGDYDAEYYVKNQIIPAVEKIFAELGIDSTDLERGGKQTGLSSFM
jgi:DNA polymerase I